MAAETGLIGFADLARVQDVEFVNKFDGNINKLMEVLGIVQPITMAPGTQLKIYKTSGTLQNAAAGAGTWEASTAYAAGDRVVVGFDVYEVTTAGTSGSSAPTWAKTGSVSDGSTLKWGYVSSKFDTNVAEGDTIPLSEYTNEVAATPTITYGKFRKATSMEAIQSRGYDQAVTSTDNKMVRDIQKGIRTSIYTFLGTGTGTATGTTFQKALANAWAALDVKFEDDDATPVYFVNPLDIADYLGTAAVTLQTAFGFSYIENFLGLGTVIVASDVPAKSIYATAKENINLYNADLAGLTGFEMYSDETGLIAVAHDAVLKNATLETVAYTGLGLFPEYLDRIVKSTIAAA